MSADDDGIKISRSNVKSANNGCVRQWDVYFVDDAAFAASIDHFDEAAVAAFESNAGASPGNLLHVIVNGLVALLNDGAGATGAYATYRACVTALPALRAGVLRSAAPRRLPHHNSRRIVASGSGEIDNDARTLSVAFLYPRYLSAFPLLLSKTLSRSKSLYSIRHRRCNCL
jgi:hypothetical protein